MSAAAEAAPPRRLRRGDLLALVLVLLAVVAAGVVWAVGGWQPAEVRALVVEPDTAIDAGVLDVEVHNATQIAELGLIEAPAGHTLLAVRARLTNTTDRPLFPTRFQSVDVVPTLLALDRSTVTGEVTFEGVLRYPDGVQQRSLQPGVPTDVVYVFGVENDAVSEEVAVGVRSFTQRASVYEPDQVIWMENEEPAAAVRMPVRQAPA